MRNILKYIYNVFVNSKHLNLNVRSIMQRLIFRSKMWPWIIATARAYAPVIVFPVAVVAGVIGYNIEGFISDKHTPWRESTIQRREERRDREADEFAVPKTIFERKTKQE